MNSFTRARLAWAAGWAALMFCGYWALVILTVGAHEFFGWSDRKYHPGDFHRYFWSYILGMVVLVVLAAILGWFVRGGYPPPTDPSGPNDENVN